jgi:hypothetical protein
VSDCKEVLIGLAGGSDIPEARGKTAGPAPFPEKGKVTVPLLYDHQSYLSGDNKRDLHYDNCDASA